MSVTNETTIGTAAGAKRTSDGGLRRYGAYIAGAERAPAGGDYFPTQDPFTCEDWALVARCTAADVDEAATSAKQAFESWSRLRPSQRGRILRKFADAISAGADRLAEIERRDNGKLAAEVNAALPKMHASLDHSIRTLEVLHEEMDAFLRDKGIRK